jgi:hypothetical protein
MLLEIYTIYVITYKKMNLFYLIRKVLLKQKSITKHVVLDLCTSLVWLNVSYCRFRI